MTRKPTGVFPELVVLDAALSDAQESKYLTRLLELSFDKIVDFIAVVF